MRIERRIDIKISLAQAREQVAAYLQQVGYKPEEAGPTLTFKRGSKLGTWTSFSPRKWQARARVDLAQASSAASPESGGGGFPLTTAIITIDVDTSGQMVTQGEREFWAQEVDGLVRTLYGADLGLAVIGPNDPAKPDAPPVFYSLALADCVLQGESRQGRAGPSGIGWLVHLGLDMVRRQLTPPTGAR